MSTDTQSPTVESLVREQHEEIRQLFRTIEGARGDDRTAQHAWWPPRGRQEGTWQTGSA